MSFAGHALSTEEVDRISATTVTELMKLVKEDHLAFVRRVSEIVASGVVPQSGLATAHTCRLGRWYDSLTDATTLALPSFRAIAVPHQAVHECGRSAVAAIAVHDMAEAQRHLAEVREHSERVVSCLDTFGQDYLTTVRQDSKELRAA